MKSKKIAKNKVNQMRCNKWSGPDAPSLEVRGHHIMCAVCARGGCKEPPPGKRVIDRLLKAMQAYPFVSLKICADIDVSRAHYFDVYENRDKTKLPKQFKKRNDDFVWRKKDLEVSRLLGIAPNTKLPAELVYNILFKRQPNLDGICRTGSVKSKSWPQCKFATKGYYEKIAGWKGYGLKEQTELGEKMERGGVWAMIRPRSAKDMKKDKDRTAKFITEKADHLYIRPQHVLCILCTAEIKEPLIQDNLIELRKRMEENPHIPVTLTEGCCEVCDPCNVYHPGEHLCYNAHIKNSLRDLMILERLGLEPGATIAAGKLYRLVYNRIPSMKDICGWRDGSNTAPFWAPCLDYKAKSLEKSRKKGVISGKKVKT